LVSYNNKGNFIQWTSGSTGLVQWNSHEFDTDKCLQTFFLSSSFSCSIRTLKYSFIFAFFIAHFLLVKNTYKNPYSRSPVNSFQAIAPLTAQEKGYFFKGAFLPKKLTPKSSIKTRYKLFQAHMLPIRLKHVPSALYGPYLHC
jgi:hypothetical protein